MKLTLTASCVQFRRDEISVIQDGVPIPYEWTGPLEITVDDIFERAAIQITPKPRWHDLRIGMGEDLEWRDTPDDVSIDHLKELLREAEERLGGYSGKRSAVVEDLRSRIRAALGNGK